MINCNHTNVSRKLVYVSLCLLLLSLFLSSSYAKSLSAFPSANFVKDDYTIDGLVSGENQPLDSRIPLLLIHGINFTQALDTDEWSWSNVGYNSLVSVYCYPEQTVGWAKFLKYYASTPALNSRYKIYLYGYRSNEVPVDQLASDLKNILDLWMLKHPELSGRDVVILAHSMGGLVARSFMTKPIGNSNVRWGDKVAALITLATPHHGTPGANSTWESFGFPRGALSSALSGSSWLYELSADFFNYFKSSVDYYQVNRSDLLWDNYSPAMLNSSCWSNRPTEQNDLLLALNSVEHITRKYDKNIITYVGSIGPVIGQLGMDLYHQGQVVIATATGMGSDGIVPVESARFDGFVTGGTRFWQDYDHSQMWMGVQADPLGEPLFAAIGQDLATIASAINRPASFRVFAQSRLVGNAPQNVITWSSAARATQYLVYRGSTLIANRSQSCGEYDDCGAVAGNTYTYSVDAISLNGGTTAVSQVCQTIANVGPDATPPGAPVNLQAFPIGWSHNNQFWVGWNNPSDPSGIAKVWYKLGQAPVSPSDGISLPLPSNDPFPVSISKVEGLDTLYVWLEDGVGNKSHLNRSNVILGYDTTPPTLRITSPQSTGCYVTSASSIVLSGVYADSLSGISNVTWLCNLSGSSSFASLIGGANAGTWSTPEINLYGGTNKITIAACDNAGNTSHVTLSVLELSVQNSGYASVNLSPQGANDAGARWRVNRGAWRTSGQIEANVPVGACYIDYLSISGWTIPFPSWINVTTGQTSYLSAAYTPMVIPQPPDRPSNPSPANGAINVGRLNPVFSWTGGSASGPVDYGFLLSTNSNPNWANSWGVGWGGVSNATVQYYGYLNPSVTYYWRAMSKGYSGLITTGDVWRFTTEYSMADLTPVAMSINGNVVPGSNVDVIVTVTNQGALAYPSAFIRLYLSRLPGAKETMLTYNVCAFTGALQPGQQCSYTQTVALAGLEAGQSFLDVWLDTTAFGPAAESRYDNNSRSMAITYVDGQAPSVTYTALQKTFLKTGTSNVIVYCAQDDAGIQTVDFFYGTDGGLSWTPIVEGYVPSRQPTYGDTYSWLVPTSVPVTTNLLLRVVARDAAGNWGERISGPYSVRDGTPPQVAILSPNGGEVWDMGSTHPVTWNVSAPNGVWLMDLLFYHDGVVENVADIHTNATGTYSWTVRNNFSTATGQLCIRLVDSSGNTSSDFSDGYFTVKDTSLPPPAPWNTPLQVTSLAINDYGNNRIPSIAVDSSGTVHMVYLYTCTTGSNPQTLSQSILYRRRTNGVWSAPQTVYTVNQQTDGALSYYNLENLGIAVSPQGVPHVVWDSSYQPLIANNQGDVFYSTLNGESWASPANLSSSIVAPLPSIGCVSRLPQIQVGSTGAVHVSWIDGYYYTTNAMNHLVYDRSGTSVVYHASRTGGGWTLPDQVTTQAVGTFSSVLISNTLHVVSVQSGANIVHEDNATGVWCYREIGSTGGGDSDALCMAPDRSNNLHLVFANYSATNRILYATCSSNSWSSAGDVAAGGIGYPKIVMDSFNSPYVLWEDDSASPPNRLLCRHRSGAGWAPPLQLNLNSQNIDARSSAAVMSAISNEIHVVWTSLANGHTEVFYNHAYVGSTNDIYLPSVTVNAPPSGSILSFGTSYNIGWSATDETSVESCDLAYTTNRGSSWIQIASNVISVGSYGWIVPNIGSLTGQVRVIARDSSGNTGSGFSAEFTIADLTPPVISLLGPLTKAILVAGDPINITWLASDNVGVTGVDIELSLNNGDEWAFIATNLANSGSFPWIVPRSATASLLLRVTARDGAGFAASVVSGQPLSIIPANTPPVQPYNPFPLPGACDSLFCRPNLQWCSGDLDNDPLTYSVTLGTNLVTELVYTGAVNGFSPSLLHPDTMYYWQVSVSDGKTNVVGPMWNFLTGIGDAPRPAFSNLNWREHGGFDLQMDGIIGDNYSVECSSNLMGNSWQPVTNVHIRNGPVVIPILVSSNAPSGFYRMISP